MSTHYNSSCNPCYNTRFPPGCAPPLGSCIPNFPKFRSPTTHSWIELTSGLVGTDSFTNTNLLTPNNSQGASCDLSADGNFLVIGGPGANLGIGAAWVFQRSKNSWLQQTQLVGLWS